MSAEPSHRPFVGRARELGELEGGLEEAHAGRGGLFLLAGEAGIGKTRLADELARRAALRGFSVHWGRAWEVGGAPAYWPWIQVLRRLVRDAGDLGISQASVQSLARLLPELGRESRETQLRDLEQDRFQLFDAVARALHEASSVAPLLVVLEDLHAADPSSLSLLLFVARGLRQSPLYLLGTYRADEARLLEDRGELLQRIAREGSYLPLRRFDRAEVLRLLADVSEGLSPALVSEVCQTTEGHPLFVDEVRRMLRLRTESGAKLSRIVVPESVSLAIDERVRKLDADAQSLLEVAAVIGREVTLPVLCAMVGRERSAVRAILWGASAAGVVVELEPELFAFSHALVREAFLNGMLAARRVELHALAASVLERTHAPEAALAEVATHLIAAQSLVGGTRALRGSCRAAERAMSAYAFEDAAAIARQALSAIAIEGCEARDVCEAWLLLGEAQVRAHVDGQSACVRAAEIAKTLDDPELCARAALALGAEISLAQTNSVLVALLEDALARLPPGETRLRARVLARLAGALQPATEPDEPVQRAREAIALARGLDDDATRLLVLVSAGSALIDYVDVLERLEVDAETLRLAERAGDHCRCFRAQLRLFFDHSELGSPREALRALSACQSLGVALGRPRFLFHVALMQASEAARIGDFEQAFRHEKQAQSHARESNDALLAVSASFFGYGLRLLKWDDDALFDSVPSLDVGSIPPASALVWLALMRAVANARRGFQELARQQLSTISLDALEKGREVNAIWFFAEACLLTSDTKHAQRLLALLIEQRGRFVCWGVFGAAILGPHSALLGRLCDCLGLHAEARAHFGDAHALCLSTGTGPALAEVEYYFGAALADSEALPERERSRELLRSALERATRFGLSGLTRRCEALLRTPTALPKAGGASATETATPEFTLTRSGDVFRIEDAAGTFFVKDSRGMRILAELVEHPGRELHVLTLMGADEVDAGGDAGSVLDANAITAYRKRLELLRESEQRAEELADASRLAQVQGEIEMLAEQLAAALGLGGRARRAGGNSERARVNVQRRVRDAIRRIEEQNPELGRALGFSIRTGTFCSFDPRRWPKLLK